ncbi:MAG: hypothetical protein H7841_04715 [Magnetospirillum sp. WYHS-4]
MAARSLFPYNRRMVPLRAPDLVSGRIVNGTGGANAWCTTIQAVLEEVRDGRRETAYLGHECRKENVPFAAGGAGPEGGIIQKNSPAEFLTFSRGGRFYQILGTETVFGGDLLAAYPHVRLGRHFVFQPHGEDDWVSRVHCPERPIRLATADAVMDGLRAGGLALGDLFLRFSWQEGATAHTLYAPSRYVNFGEDYLQPISGYVLFRHQDLWLHGYLACALKADGTRLCELVAPVYTDAYAVIAKQSRLEEADRAALAGLAAAAPAYTRQFNLVLHLDGQLDFFVYDRD